VLWQLPHASLSTLQASLVAATEQKSEIKVCEPQQPLWCSRVGLARVGLQLQLQPVPAALMARVFMWKFGRSQNAVKGEPHPSIHRQVC
jgi:hypothetical protein